MSARVEIDDVEAFRAVVANVLGLRFEDAKSGFLGEVLRRRLVNRHQCCADYLDALERGDRDEVAALAAELTVAETYFFRNMDQFRALRNEVLPRRMRARSAQRHLEVLSAGCASGEEAYSIAMLARDVVDPSWRLTIRAVDVNPEVLERARRGRYSAWALRETSPALVERWFSHDGRQVVLNDDVLDAVTFEQRNLADDDHDLWAADRYDVVFCRNVMMYFTPDQARALVAHIARALVPGGYLFLGHAETLRGLTHDFHLCHTDGTFYYQRKCPGAPVDAGWEPEPITRDAPLGTPLAVLVDEAQTWVDAIQAATERVEELTRASTAAPPDDPAVVARPWDLAVPLRLLQEERFDAALDHVDALPPAAALDPDVLLLEAALLTHRGHLERAEDACRRLLAIDELNAGAHYLLALCREGVSDRDGAVDHDRIAVHLDADFAMPHLHLGLLARRTDDLGTARTELHHAIELLEQEDASRLLLFGGGFSRDALTALCHAELVACREGS